MLEKQQENPQKKAGKIFYNRSKPFGQAILPVIVMGILADAPYPLTVQKIRLIAKNMGFGMPTGKAIQSIINNIDIYCSRSASLHLVIREEKAPRTHARNFQLIKKEKDANT